MNIKIIIYLLGAFYVLFMIYVIMLNDRTNKNNPLLNNKYMNNTIQNNLSDDKDNSFSLSNGSMNYFLLKKNKKISYDKIRNNSNIEHYKNVKKITSKIPKIIYQTYHRKHKIPQKV